MLIQLVIMAQMELLPKIQRIKNFYDRVTLKYIINPLDAKETMEMIQFRLKQAGFNGKYELFSEGAVQKVFEHTMGYPRRISILCHNALEKVVMEDRPRVDEGIIHQIIQNEVV